MNKHIFFLSFMLIFGFLAGAFGQEKSIPEEQAIATQNDNIGSFIWAWEVPKDDHEKYPITEHYFWNPVQEAFAAGFGYSNSRSRRNEDGNSISYGVSMRPFAYRFDEDTTLTMGLIVAGSNQFSTSPELDAATPADSNTETRNYSISASFFFSAPSLGMQATLDLGYYFARIYNEADDLNQTGAVSRFYQRERGMVGFLQVNLLKDSLYLYGLDLAISWSLPFDRSKVDVDIQDAILTGGQRVEIDDAGDIRTGSFSSILYARAFAVEVFHNYRITLEPAFGFSYFANDHGHGLLTGLRLNVFDSFGVSVFQDWQFNNDVSDKFIVNVELGFRFGRRFGNVSRSVFNAL